MTSYQGLILVSRILSIRPCFKALVFFCRLLRRFDIFGFLECMVRFGGGIGCCIAFARSAAVDF